jgi:hypothetical protein
MSVQYMSFSAHADAKGERDPKCQMCDFKRMRVNPMLYLFKLDYRIFYFTLYFVFLIHSCMVEKNRCSLMRSFKFFGLPKSKP